MTTDPFEITPEIHTDNGTAGRTRRRSTRAKPVTEPITAEASVRPRTPRRSRTPAEVPSETDVVPEPEGAIPPTEEEALQEHPELRHDLRGRPLPPALQEMLAQITPKDAPTATIVESRTKPEKIEFRKPGSGAEEFFRVHPTWTLAVNLYLHKTEGKAARPTSSPVKCSTPRRSCCPPRPRPSAHANSFLAS